MMPASTAAVRLRPSSISTVKPTMPSSAISARSRHCAGCISLRRGPGSPRTITRQSRARHGEPEQHEGVDGDLGRDRLAERHVGAGQRHGGDKQEHGGEAGGGAASARHAYVKSPWQVHLRPLAGSIEGDCGGPCCFPGFAIPRGDGQEQRSDAMGELSPLGIYLAVLHRVAAALRSSSGMRRAHCRAWPRFWPGLRRWPSSFRPCSMCRRPRRRPTPSFAGLRAPSTETRGPSRAARNGTPPPPSSSRRWPRHRQPPEARHRLRRRRAPRHRRRPEPPPPAATRRPRRCSTMRRGVAGPLHRTDRSAALRRRRRARGTGGQLGRRARLLRHGPRAQGGAEAHLLHDGARAPAGARARPGDGAQVAPGAQHRAPLRAPHPLLPDHHLRAGRGPQAALHHQGDEGADARGVHRHGAPARRRQPLVQGPGGGVRARLQHGLRLRALPHRADGLRPEVRRRLVPLQLAVGRRLLRLRLRPRQRHPGPALSEGVPGARARASPAPRASA